VVFAANGRVKPNVVFVKGKEERHPEGQYYIEWRDPKRKREKVGTDAAEADAHRRPKEAELAAINHGAIVAKPALDASSRRRLIAAIDEYLTDVKLKEQINKARELRTPLDVRLLLDGPPLLP